ncbi:hypothetical protein [Streptomyces sp. NPDC051662]|uniref:hypothetical protein n=1 Tax=Streptomyces sp. NPDC051662 TaxID=3154750 RepID=UPI00344958D9
MGARLDLRISLERIASARYDLRFPDAYKSEDGVLEVAIASQTSIIVELAQPVNRRRPVGAARGGSYGPLPRRRTAETAVAVIKKLLPMDS